MKTIFTLIFLCLSAQSFAAAPVDPSYLYSHIEKGRIRANYTLFLDGIKVSAQYCDGVVSPISFSNASFEFSDSGWEKIREFKRCTYERILKDFHSQGLAVLGWEIDSYVWDDDKYFHNQKLINFVESPSFEFLKSRGYSKFVLYSQPQEPLIKFWLYLKKDSASLIKDESSAKKARR